MSYRTNFKPGRNDFGPRKAGLGLLEFRIWTRLVGEGLILEIHPCILQDMNMSPNFMG